MRKTKKRPARRAGLTKLSDKEVIDDLRAHLSYLDVAVHAGRLHGQNAPRTLVLEDARQIFDIAALIREMADELEQRAKDRPRILGG